MSRFSDSEDWDGPNTSGLWWHSFRRAINSDRGQKALREIEAALLALPTKRLIADELANARGDVCAVGAVAAQRQVEHGQPRGDAVRVLSKSVFDGEDTVEYARDMLGMAKTIARELVEENDRELWGWTVAHELPEARYERVLAWVRERIKPVEVAG